MTRTLFRTRRARNTSPRSFRAERAARLDTRRADALPLAPLPTAGTNDARWFPTADAALYVSCLVTGRGVTLTHSEQQVLYRALDLAADHGHGDAESLAAKLGCF